MYSISAPYNPQDMEYFEIQPESGWIVLKKPLDVSALFYARQFFLMLNSLFGKWFKRSIKLQIYKQFFWVWESRAKEDWMIVDMRFCFLFFISHFLLVSDKKKTSCLITFNLSFHFWFRCWLVFFRYNLRSLKFYVRYCRRFIIVFGCYHTRGMFWS